MRYTQGRHQPWHEGTKTKCTAQSVMRIWLQYTTGQRPNNGRRSEEEDINTLEAVAEPKRLGGAAPTACVLSLEHS